MSGWMDGVAYGELMVQKKEKPRRAACVHARCPPRLPYPIDRVRLPSSSLFWTITIVAVMYLKWWWQNSSKHSPTSDLYSHGTCNLTFKQNTVCPVLPIS